MGHFLLFFLDMNRFFMSQCEDVPAGRSFLTDFQFGSLGWLLHLVGWKEWKGFIGRKGISYEGVVGWT